ncbi:MAG: MFS transporter [Anaerolineae bacterium]|jgi:fucose permease|nr:MFS transporter [Anaerolineae bacterium]
MKTVATHTRRSAIGLIILIYVAFISLGLPDGLMGVAWPSIRATFSQPLDALGVLLLFSTSGYLASSSISGRIISRWGVGKLLAASCVLTGLGLIGYTLVPNWWMMIALGLVAGLGAGAIDAGINTYVAANFGEKLMQWLHASYGIGVTLGPLIMTAGLNLFEDWHWGYQVVGLAQLALAASFMVTLPLWQRKPDRGEAKSQPERRLTDYKTSYRETLRQPMVWLSFLIFYLYTGAEATLGSWAYTLLTESRGISIEIAGLWAGSYWATFTLGRFLAGLYNQRIGLNTLISGSLLGALAGSLLLWWNPVGIASLVGVGLIGFAIAPIFPGLVSGTRERVGVHYAANTIGMQVSAAALGAATLPGLAGILAQRIFSLEIIPVYLAILFAAQLGLYALATSLAGARKLNTALS